MLEVFSTYPWLLPIVIFLGRICDVTLGTLRIIFVSKGERYKAPIVGFFEVFIWVVVIGQIFSGANDIISYLAYAAGYATGNYVGILVENKIAFGYQLFRIYTKGDNGAKLAKVLSQNGFGTTHIKGTGSVSEVDIIESVIIRKKERKMVALIDEFDPNAFYVIEDIRARRSGIFSINPLSSADSPGIGK